MLSQLHIRNFAIIEALEIEFKPGETVLTGKTGAGKSILLDALSLVLGDRADASVVRENQNRADITAVFDIAQVPAARAWLQAQALEQDNECILRRIINRDGRSKAYINAQPATLQTMRELGELLVSIHGQHEHQALLKREVQRQRLDDYAAHQTLLQSVVENFNVWSQLQTQLQKLQLADSRRSERLHMLGHQVQELEKFNLKANEYAELDVVHKRLSHASDLLSTGQQSLLQLYDGDEQTLHQHLNRMHNNLLQLLRMDETLEPVATMLNSAMINIEEAAHALRAYLDKLELDPEQLQLTEERISGLHDLARKHHVQPKQLYDLSLQLKTELENLENADERLQQMQQALDQHLQNYHNYARQLRASRQHAAKKLSDAVTQAMQQLGMQGGCFLAALNDNEKNEPGKYGMDQIEFLVSANPGQTPKSLSRVASGGELSRISLAIQMITAGNEPIPTLIFDEVDAGIGGAIAEMVGRHLRSLGEQRQVLCVTHLPQVAAQAHHHLYVSKSGEQSMRTQISELSASARVQEIARMLGGLQITENTLKHAEEMLATN